MSISKSRGNMDNIVLGIHIQFRRPTSHIQEVSRSHSAEINDGGVCGSHGRSWSDNTEVTQSAITFVPQVCPQRGEGEASTTGTPRNPINRSQVSLVTPSMPAHHGCSEEETVYTSKTVAENARLARLSSVVYRRCS